MKMLYIHKLTDFGRKSADNESIYILRDIKQRFSLPISPEKLERHVYEFYISDTDVETIREAIELIQPTLESLKVVIGTKNKFLEPINFERSINILSSLLSPLANSLDYCTKLKDSQEQNVREIASLINIVPLAKSSMEKNALNEGISKFFEVLFRNKEFMFNSADIINEGTLNAIHGLDESAVKGFFYHCTLEEELKKIPPHTIKAKLPAESIEIMDNVEMNIMKIKKGVEKAYYINRNMVELSVIIYSFIKWANGS